MSELTMKEYQQAVTAFEKAERKLVTKSLRDAEKAQKLARKKLREATRSKSWRCPKCTWSANRGKTCNNCGWRRQPK